MRALLTAAAYAAAFLVIAGLEFCLLMGVANSTDAAWMEAHGLGAVNLLLFGWVTALVLPVFFARVVWRRLGRQDHH